jgi:hypothetical protein
MKYAVEVDSCAVIYVPSFIMICPGITKLLGVCSYRRSGTEQCDLVSLLSCGKERRLEMQIIE